MAATFNDEYRHLLELLVKSDTEVNSRTGHGVNVLRGGHSFKLDLSDGRLPSLGNRRYWPHVAAAETAWQFMGTRSPDWILSKAPRLWSEFVEDGLLKTAYGYRWREHFGRDQLGMAMEELRTNRTNRQLYVSAWDPAADGLGAPNQPRNIPCPVGFSLTTSFDEVHCSMFLRSSDVVIGLPYDVMGYAMTLAAIAEEIGFAPGVLHVTLANAHFYDVHEDIVRTSLRASWERDPGAPLVTWSVSDILTDPDGYVDAVRESQPLAPSHPYSPLPELVV